MTAATTTSSSNPTIKGAAAPVLDPVNRTSSPYPDPRTLGPKSQLLAAGTSNYHSTSLRNSQYIHQLHFPLYTIYLC